MQRTVLRALMAAIVGITVALGLVARTASAMQEPCERNACRLSTGNCDMVDVDLSCVELPFGGCSTYGCGAQ